MCSLKRWPLEGDKESCRLLREGCCVRLVILHSNQLFLNVPTGLLFLPYRENLTTYKRRGWPRVLSVPLIFSSRFLWLQQLVLPLDGASSVAAALERPLLVNMKACKL